MNAATGRAVRKIPVGPEAAPRDPSVRDTPVGPEAAPRDPSVRDTPGKRPAYGPNRFFALWMAEIMISISSDVL